MRLTLLLSCCAILSAAVIRVPGDSARIQAGLNGALSGDTVLVAPGTFYERIVWPVQDGIVLLSESGPDSTTIHGGDAGRVVTMTAGQYTSATVIQGFTITHGRVSTYPGNGAGIGCTGSPTLSGNRIVNNVLENMGYGGGVYAAGAPVMHHNLVAWDTIWNPGGGGWRYGAGVFCAGSGVFYQNVFLENAAMDTFGGGFWYGGGLCLMGGSPVVFSNLFLRNRVGATTGGLSYGGGLYIDSAAAYVANNTFVANTCTTAIPYGGAVYVKGKNAVLKNNIMVQNVATGIAPFGGGIACQPDTLDTLVFDFNDVWGNEPTDYYACMPGEKAISDTPHFVTAPHGDYCLSQIAAGQLLNSPCFDAGDTLLMTLPLNLDSLAHAWTTRTDSVPDAGPIDMGYHYAPEPAVGLAEKPMSGTPKGGITIQPNPFRDRARISYDVRQPGRVSVRVFDASGRLAANVLEAEQAAGRHEVVLDHRLVAGVYFASVTTGTDISRVRCTVVE